MAGFGGLLEEHFYRLLLGHLKTGSPMELLYHFATWSSYLSSGKQPIYVLYITESQIFESDIQTYQILPVITSTGGPHYMWEIGTPKIDTHKTITVKLPFINCKYEH